MVQMRPHTPLACGHPHFCQGAKSKKEAEPGQMFVVHYATRWWAIGFWGGCVRARMSVMV